jgi:Ca2+-binding EF-hand superfamily protein
MYRMLDVDHDGSVSVPEFTLGLKELGFPTHNKATVRQLQKEIDNKGTGIIRVCIHPSLPILL